MPYFIKRKNIWPFYLFLLTVVLFFVVVLFLSRNISLHIDLYGKQNMTLEYGTAYCEPGAKVSLSVKVCFQDYEILIKDPHISVTGEVKSDLGVYPINYEAKYLFWSAKAVRSVSVIDTQCPVIELEEPPSINSTDHTMPVYQATDNYDGDITEHVIHQEQDGVITFAVTDSSGNPAYASWERPKEIPEIILAGENPLFLTVGRMYGEPGCTAIDEQDGDLSNSVVVNGYVDWLTPGIYPVDYHVIDKDQNEAVVTRNVHVQAKERPDTLWPEEKTVYLTFDDGPGPETLRLLDLLEKYHVKATFFVTDSEYGYLLKEIVKRGHSIGIHSVSHNYKDIYLTPEAFFEDLFAMQQIIFENTGVVTTLMRFPGGGSNLVSRQYNKGIMSKLTEAVQDAGFQYFDWNVDSDDAGKAQRSKDVQENVIRGIQETGISMVLQHDIHAFSVDAVEEIILWALDNGYTFQAIRNSTPGFHHDVLN